MRNRFGIFIVLGWILICCGCTTLKENKRADYSLLRGVNLSEQGDLEGALREYENSYKLNPDNAVLLKEMAFIYYKFADQNRAEELWLKALAISPKDDNVIKNLSFLYYERGEYSKAKEIIKESYNPNADYYLKIKGLMVLKENNKKEALELFEKIRPEAFDIETYLEYLNLGEEYYTTRDLYNILKKGELLFGSNKEYVLANAKILTERLKGYDEAEKILLKYIMEKGNDRDILMMLSDIYMESGNEEKAKDTLLLITDKDNLL